MWNLHFNPRTTHRPEFSSSARKAVVASTSGGRRTRQWGTDFRSRASRAFTLIEVLVVVAVIALLVSILLPSLNKARAQARSVVCASNLRQMGYAGLFYQEKYNGYPPVRLKEVYNRPPAPGKRSPIVTA